MEQIKSYDTFSNVKEHVKRGRILSKGSTLTIASGAITVTDSFHFVETEGGASTDDLLTINGGATAGQVVVLKALNGNHTVNFPGGSGASGNVKLGSTNALPLSTTTKSVTLVYTGSEWHGIAGWLAA